MGLHCDIGSKYRKIMTRLGNRRRGWIYGANKKLRLKLILIFKGNIIQASNWHKIKKQEAGFPKKKLKKVWRLILT